MTLTQEHIRHLTEAAVDIDVATELGVYSATEPDQVPEQLDGFRNLPALVFPWTSPSGHVEYQVRPDNPSTDKKGRKVKYRFRSSKNGYRPVLWAARPHDGVVLIVEGTKQTLAAASHAPDEVAVYGIGGCRQWSSEGLPIDDLEVVEGREVVIILDADAATNREVYDAGVKLADALRLEGATKVSFARLPGRENDGLDDVLAAKAEDRRTRYLERLIRNAKSNPADKRPPAKAQKIEGTDERPLVVVNDDRLEVITTIMDTLTGKYDQDRLFDYGGALTLRNDATLQPLTRDPFGQLVVESVTAVTINSKGEAAYAWPDPQTMGTMLSMASKFSPLDRVAQTPFVRPDGSVVTEPGYDPATGAYLLLDDDLGGIEVPESPSGDDVRAAVELILDDWLGDFEWGDEASRANALALVLTPAVRNLVSLVPLAVIDGLQMGVGKNKIANCVSLLYTGAEADPLPYTTNDEEHRKVITAAFREGRPLFVFDEAHELSGSSFARAITSATYKDRLLGKSDLVYFPNRITWMALGNNVRVHGDMTRRVYRVFIAPNRPNPQDRPADTFRHPDLEGWTRSNRAELLTAVLTLVRAWFSAGSPPPSKGVSFGSFEGWDRTVGGIIETAGIGGFLDNLVTWRSDSDFATQYWTAHLAWLYEVFGGSSFTSAQARSAALENMVDFPAPPGLDDPAEKGYAKRLGESYYRIKGRRFEEYSLIKVGGGHGHVTTWAVRKEDDLGDNVKNVQNDPVSPESDGGSGGTQGTSHTLSAREHFSSRARAHARVKESRGEGPYGPPAPPSSGPVVVDLETADANEMYRYGPGFARLAGVGTDDGIELTTDMGSVVETIRSSSLVSGHNIMAFDLPALARYHGLDMAEVHDMAEAGRLSDTLLVARHLDPPMARDKGVEARGRYKLDTLGETYGLGRKTDDLKGLAKEFGGFDQIPVDDERYRAYLIGDIELSTKLGSVLRTKAGEDPYLVREHRVAAIAAQITHNGFRIDLDLLDARVNQVAENKLGALAELNEKYGIPMTDPKGKPYASPLATRAGKDRLIEVLTSFGVTSFWTTGKTGDIATSYEAMKNMAQMYGHIPEVVEIAKLVARVVTSRTIYNTITDNLVGDRVHPKVNMKQSTGRWSLTDPGLTVVGKRGDRWHEREVFLPDPGEVIVAVDLSQVDMRAVAGLSKDAAYISMLESEDPHTEIAKVLFNDPSRREEAKAIGHGWNYSRGVRAIAEDNDLDPGIVKQFDRSMRERFPRLVEWQEEVRARAEDGHLLDNGFGRPMRADPARAFTQGPALMGQGAARDIMMEGLLRLNPEVLPMLRAQVHDEIVLSVPEDIAQDVEDHVIDALSFEWNGVPIVAEGGPHGSSWGSVYAK